VIRTSRLANARRAHRVQQQQTLAELRLAADGEGPRAARAWLSGIGSGQLGPERLGDALLLVSELVSNSVEHVGVGPIVLSARMEPERLRVEVCDPGPGLPADHFELPAPEAPRGRGLALVEGLSDRWGAGLEGRSCVWFEVAGILPAS
jgi:anti-sigma regulatory factor (Ser/Thr protein kinase)